MQLLSAINANGTTVLMATHDAGIVDQMQRRVIELVSGQVVRDERGGGYQTQAVPVQKRSSRRAAAPTAVPRAAAPPRPHRRPPRPRRSHGAPRRRPTPAADAAPQPRRSPPSPTSRSSSTAPHTGTITVVEPAVTNVRETPKEMPRPLHRDRGRRRRAREGRAGAERAERPPRSCPRPSTNRERDD